MCSPLIYGMLLPMRRSRTVLKAVSTAIAAIVLLSACGDDEGSADAEVDPSAVEENTDTSAADTSVSEATTAGPGLLTLLEVEQGRVEVTVNGWNEPGSLRLGSADFHQGGQVLRFDSHDDLDQVINEYRPVLEDRSRGMEAWAIPALPDSDPTVHRAAVADLVAALYLSNSLLLAASEDCAAELASTRDEFLSEPSPSPEWQPNPDGPEGSEIWDYPVESVPLMPSCVRDLWEDEADPKSTVLQFERDLARGLLDVRYDPGYYTDGRTESLVLFALVDDEPDGDAPPAPPTTLFDPATRFLLATNHCGALPSAYSNFMAGNSYTAPSDPNYVEPGVFTSGYVCEADVPR